jgi:DNA-binding CsgD family transcriptional regulator
LTWNNLYLGLEMMETAQSWTELLGTVHEALAQVVDFDVCSCLLHHDTPSGAGTLEGHIGPADDAWLAQYRDYYHRLVPPAFVEPHRATLLGTVHASRDYGDHEFTRDFLRARRISAFTAVVIPARAQGSFVTVNFNFTLFLAEQHAGELAVLERLRRHAHRLFLLQDKIDHLERNTVGLEHGLTKREEEVAEAAVRRLTASQIALQLGVSRRTVESHLLHIYEKFGVLNRKQLLQAMARRIL